MAINWREYVQTELERIIAEGKLPHMIGGGRRTIIIPEPQPEDERPLFNTEGEVKAGCVRAEITRRCWASKDGNVAIRVFKGDVIDIPEAEFATFYERNWAREPWKKPEAKQPAPEPTKQRATLSITG